MAPGTNAGTLSTGNLILNTGSTFLVELDGLTPAIEYDQLAVTGTVDLAGARLVVQPGFTPSDEATFVLIANDGNDPVVGVLDGLSEGADVSLNGERYRISYAGGDGNDVVLTNRVAVYDFNAPSYTVAEGDVAATTRVVEITRTNNLLFASSVDVVLSDGTATSGADYSAGPIRVEFLPGETTKTIPIEVLGESTVEADETIGLLFSNASDSGVAGTTQPTATLTITNDDSATVILENRVASPEGTGDSNDFYRTSPCCSTTPFRAASSLSFNVNDGTATANDDFEIQTSGPLVFEGNANESQSIVVRIYGDTKVEADETFQVALGAVSGLLGIDSSSLTIGTSASGVILNDDSSELTIVDVTQDEDAGEMIFTVTLRERGSRWADHRLSNGRWDGTRRGFGRGR